MTGRMVILVIATVLATGDYMSAFSYLSLLATGRSGLPAGAVPLIFVVFGVGAIIGPTSPDGSPNAPSPSSSRSLPGPWCSSRSQQPALPCSS